MEVGRILGKAYRVERALGAGGVGAVYEATQIRTGRRYAVKVLLPEIAMREGAAARFRREAEALAAVGHAGIVQIHDFDSEDDGTQFLVMDLLEGEDLATRIARVGPLDVAAALRILDEIGSALSAAHAIGIVHRDLKPANVFLARRAGSPERATLLDFGLAKNLAGPSVHLTATGVGLGTPLYMSPEQARGEEVDLRTDVYALGCILFEMLTGAAPFQGSSISVVIAKILTEDPPLVSARAGRPTPPALDEVVRMALAKAPSDRYATVRALIDAAHRAGGDSSDRALAATALPASPVAPLAATTPLEPIVASSPQPRPQPKPLPATREGIEAVPSLRPPDVVETTGAVPIGTVRNGPAVGATTTTGPALTPWAWVGAGVVATLAVLGLASVTRPYLHDREEDSPHVVSPASPTLEADRAPTPEPTTLALRPEPVAEVPPVDLAQVDRAPVDRAPVDRAPVDRAPDDRALAEPVVRERPRPARARAPQPTSQEVAVDDPARTAPAAAAATSAVPVPPAATLASLTDEQRAMVASQSAAAIRQYDAQIAANERRVQEYEALIPDVLELRRQARLVARGDRPAACTNALRQRLSTRSRGDESMVASVSTSLEAALDPVCTAFESWEAPPTDVLQQFQSVARDLDRSEQMLTEAPRDAPADQLETVRRALASFRRMHESQPASFARYPCRGGVMSEIEEASQVPNGWLRTAAERPHRTAERACTAMGMSDRRLGQLSRVLSERTDAAEQQLRQGIQTYADMSARLRAARAVMVSRTTP